MLVQLTDLKANKPGITLMHYLVALSNQNNPNLLNFTSELTSVKKARSVDVEYYASELRSWAQKITDLEAQTNNATPDIQSQAKGESIFHSGVRNIFRQFHLLLLQISSSQLKRN